MPTIYCSDCKRETQHKVIMKKCDSQIDTLGGRVLEWTQLMAKFMSGEHYYKMEPQYYCRCCNHRAVGEILSLPARQHTALIQ